MRERNLSPLKMFIGRAAGHVQEFHFPRHGGTFNDWKGVALPRVLETLGASPERVEPDGELVCEWVDRGVRKRRYLIDLDPFCSAALQVNLPADTREPLPALLCWHGHGPYGKDSVMGNESGSEVRDHIRAFNHD